MERRGSTSRVRKRALAHAGLLLALNGGAVLRDVRLGALTVVLSVLAIGAVRAIARKPTGRTRDGRYYASVDPDAVPEDIAAALRSGPRLHMSRKASIVPTVLGFLGTPESRLTWDVFKLERLYGAGSFALSYDRIVKAHLVPAGEVTELNMLLRDGDLMSFQLVTADGLAVRLRERGVTVEVESKMAPTDTG